MTPTPGQPLSEADVSLLKKGDLLRALKPAYGPEVRIETGDVVAFEKTEHGLIGVLGDFWGAHAFTFLGRPDQDGPSDERWSPVIDGDDGYFVSDHGRFFGPKGQLKPFRNSRVGHTAIKMHPSKRTLLAHVAVARAFIGPRPEGTYVAHLNGIPDDNRRENLSYVSPAENSAHRRAHGTSMYAGRHPNAKFSDEDVRAIRALGPNASRRDLARQYGVHRGTIESIIAGRSWRQVDMTPAPGPHAPVSRPGDGVEGGGRKRIDYGKPGDPSGCYFPKEWRLLSRAREYVADALDAHEHSDGRDLINEIDAALTPPAEPISRPAGEGEREAVARIIDPSAFLFAPDELPKGSRAQYDAFDKADRILSLLSPAAPDAGGGGEEDIMRTQEDWSALLYGRDSFIVRKGLWSEFVDSLPALQPGGER